MLTVEKEDYPIQLNQHTVSSMRAQVSNKQSLQSENTVNNMK